ncbi:hypothetical protein B0T11DRAFT_60882 [Plectosphaerella cucumerina]|uniref:DnaJ homologue subfamily C member 28 conserved domain-containing protein n=1 Tax=Plectosphaerella cucumerina TaxID=40658 RepID=A0A8K0TMB5_9PEZI|nr:hypothetical protein B0T11DRAFT_60882 [Plectosphaerella cucumerina]
MATTTQKAVNCQRCLKAWRARAPALQCHRRYSQKPKANSPTEAPDNARHSAPSVIDSSDSNKGAMTRRLEAATEEALLTGGESGRRAIEDAGFSEELKARLLEKVQAADFRQKHAGAFAQADTSTLSSAHAAYGASAPWTGTESQPDAVLRMLDDARKPLRPELRGKYQIPNPVDLRPRSGPRKSIGQRVANAREQAGAYADMGIKQKDKGLTEEEREAMKREFRDRFGSAARAVPATVSGIAALANQRIENAIARGQFRNIPRGKDAAPRDARVDNPFIDTTEYLLNKMIQKQDMVPPWIEKQQDVTKAARIFRLRLRNEWKRHAARMISSKGGTLEDQIQRAEGYAIAEARLNPRQGAIDSGDGAPDPAPSNPYSGTVFRDPDWEKAEKAYMELSIEHINALTRSYNLMAPELAKKPYFSLDRELRACFAEVAPLIAGTIKERATKPATPLTGGDGGLSKGRVSDRFGNEGSATAAKVYDSKAPHYGLKEMWRDMWGGGGRSG